MARSVSTPRDSAFVEYANFQVDGDPDWEWDYAIEDFQSQILEAFPSTCASTEWIGRENHAVAENNFAYFGVSEYCGLPPSKPSLPRWLDLALDRRWS